VSGIPSWPEYRLRHWQPFEGPAVGQGCSQQKGNDNLKQHDKTCQNFKLKAVVPVDSEIRTILWAGCGVFRCYFYRILVAAANIYLEKSIAEYCTCANYLEIPSECCLCCPR
jgi:hypothetical protein